ncbi:MAG: radical SAM protein, partial [Magnetococcales bacterium]|nr:radical SAM protein [Magnetococcales bacterium]
KIILSLPNSKWANMHAHWHLHPYPLGLLASMLDKSLYELRVVDANIDNLTLDEFGKIVEEWQPDMVGLSVLANEYGTTGHKAAKAVKHVSRSIVVVMGGVYPTTRPDSVMEDPNVDYAVLGEGEFVFPQLLKSIQSPGQNGLPTAGIAYREAGKVVIKPQTHFIQDLDAMPYPDYSEIDFYRYANTSFKHVVDAPRALPYAKLNTSRGCPIGCTFCQVETISGRNTRFQSPKRIVDEIEYLVEQHGIKAIDFLDDNFLGNRRRSIGLFKEMIQRKLPIVWNAANVSSFFLSESLLDLMKEANCVYVSIAVESGVPRVLKDIFHKPVSLEHTKKMFDHCRKLGFDTASLWVVGAPGETWEEIRTTIRVAEEMDADYTKINVAVPYPGTILFDMAVQGGYLPANFGFEDLGWGQAVLSTEEFDAKELMILRAFEWDRINFTSPVKRAKIARMMGVTEKYLKTIRKNTLRSALGHHETEICSE